ncbi:MAG: signal peptide peptidase SppA [Hyphomicrobiaceae bacterium]|nr:signal peptide peptidase SppA [Hyphomicrobiaceae bacterium]
MTLDTEALLERRRLRRRLSFWRSLGIAAVVLLLGGFVLGSDSVTQWAQPQQIARVAIEGAITEDREQLELLKRVAAADHVRGLVVYINSPGGTTTGGESLYEALRKIAEKKPVVAQFGTLATSAGYIAGLGTDYIVARGNTVTGSVGVLVQWPEVDQMLEKLGVKMNTIKSGPLKATPNPFEPIDEESRKVTQDMIGESFKWFVSLVEDRRKIKVAEVPGLEAGRVFSGREALQHKLVDQIGGEGEAVQWLEGRGVESGLKVVDWKQAPPGGSFWFSSSVSSFIGSAFGEAGKAVAEALTGDNRLRIVGLDGLLSVWHPSEK